MRGYSQNHESLIDYFHKEWYKSVHRMKNNRDHFEANEMTIRYEEKQSNAAVKAPNFKAFDFEHYKTLKQAESWRPKAEEVDGGGSATKPVVTPENRTIYTENRQIYGESIRYSDMAAKPASSEKYQPPHRRA
ncbi:uncharacterized protein LOC134816641 [Bolinopsis microptera]|uniref:uncharacterized protein LOC134816641 n=1 Tax=Bolinopsis microptera TaxID=2820187 RepID=UPI003078B6BF